jgi:cytochrome c oxidase subunit I
MATYSFSLPVPEEPGRRIAAGWLLLSVLALALSGLYAVLIVLSRTPYVGDVFPWVDFFHIALVVHVDLSVLVWFLAFAGIFWTMYSAGHQGWLPRLALGTAVAGTVVMSAAPFLGANRPIIANYVPVLDHWLFLSGLILFGAGFFLAVLHGLMNPRRKDGWNTPAGTLHFGILTAMLAALLTLLSVVWSWVGMPEYVFDKEFYEVLFWGGGHVLQFMHGQLVLVTWLWLASIVGLRPTLSPRVVLLLLALGIAFAFLAPAIYLIHDVGSPEYRLAFTWIMAIGGGLAAFPIGLAVVVALVATKRADLTPDTQPERRALIFSILLFGIGGILGFMITGSNTIVPAHYHGSTVGITMAYMGLTWYLLPRLGFRAVAPRMARVQPLIFGGGQLMHVLGLAWSGGHGVQRKTAGAAQGLENLPEILGMALVGIGGLTAVAGGVLFLLLVYWAVAPRSWPGSGG